MNEKILKVVAELGVCKPTQIAIAVGAESVRDITETLRGLREDNLLHLDGRGLYQLKSQYEKTYRPARPSREIRSENQNAPQRDDSVMPQEKQESPDALEFIKAAQQAVKKQGPEKAPATDRPAAVREAIAELREKLSKQPPAVADKALKLEVLERLAMLMSDDIAEVLSEISSDLSALPEVVV